MKLAFKAIQKNAIQASDGEIGSVKDLYFDDRTWRVRYVVVDTGKFLPGREVLLSPKSFDLEPVNALHQLRTQLSKNQIKRSPGVEEHLPISRQYEQSLHDHYGWLPYWSEPMPVAPYPFPGTRAGSSYTLAHADWDELREERERKFSGNLRSLDEMDGYRIHSSDEEAFGEVSDVVLNTSGWVIEDLILKSRKWMPGGKTFLCSPSFVREISSEDRILHVVLDKETLLSEPEFDASVLENFESGLPGIERVSPFTDLHSDERGRNEQL